jgi:dTDP-4-dehydrorhamnose 3,5-epimerase
MRQLKIQGAFVNDHNVHGDSRGLFREWYKKSSFDSANINFEIAQANHSISEKFVLRGVHYSIAAKGQAKLVTCVAGEILDVIIDLRIGSPTYLKVEKVNLNPESGNVLFIPSGVGHSFLVLSESASVVYLTSSEFDPENEKTVSPLDPALGLEWPENLMNDLSLSERDKAAPTLAEAKNAGHLPHFLG